MLQWWRRDMHMKEDAWGVVGLVCEGEKALRRSECNSDKGRTWSRHMEGAPGRESPTQSWCHNSTWKLFHIKFGNSRLIKQTNKKTNSTCVVEMDIFLLADAVQQHINKVWTWRNTANQSCDFYLQSYFTAAILSLIRKWCVSLNILLT